jgi:hypothetical protein
MNSVISIDDSKRSGLTSLRVRNFDYNYAASVINMIN